MGSAASMRLSQLSLGMAQTLLAEALLAAALTPVLFGGLGWARRVAGGN